jgi:hypothetical protein
LVNPKESANGKHGFGHLVELHLFASYYKQTFCMARKKLKRTVEDELLVSSRRRCCICFGLARDFRVKSGQVAHLDRDSSNDDPDNLAFLCLEHHDQYDTRRSQSKGLTVGEVKTFRDELHREITNHWSLSTLTEVIVDIYSGTYTRDGEIDGSTLVVRYLGNQVVSVTGLALYGKTMEFGPNIGEVDFVSALVKNTTSFADNVGSTEYKLDLTFLADRLICSENSFGMYHGAGVTFAGVYKRVVKNESLTPPGTVQFNYMRLFGAVEVPLLMTLMEAKERLIAAKKLGPGFFRLEGNGQAIGGPLIDFWINEWEFKAAQPITAGLWSKYAGSQRMGITLYRTALRGGVGDLLAYASHPDVNQQGDLPNQLNQDLDLGLSDEAIYNITGTQSNDVGFLFLILSNSSNQRITDITLYFDEFKNPLLLQEAGSFKEIIQKPDPANFALRETELDKAPHTKAVLKLASMGPTDSLIWLLSVYRKDADGLPDFYLTDVIRPSQVTFFNNGSEASEVIRAPYGLDAARIPVPSGWFHQ